MKNPRGLKSGKKSSQCVCVSLNCDALPSPLLDPLEGLSMLNYGKLGLEGHSRLPTLKGVRGAC
jgi:hypothetical protein